MGREEMLSKGGVIALWEKDVQRLMSVSVPVSRKGGVVDCGSQVKQTHLVKSRAADDSEDE